MGPLLSAIVSGIAAATAGNALNAVAERSRKNKDERQTMPNDDLDIYVGDDGDEVAGDVEIEIGRARARARSSNGAVLKRVAFLNGSSIAAGATATITQPVNRAFKCVWMLFGGTNQSDLDFLGATIRGIPQEVSAGAVGVGLFTTANPSYFWDWDTVNPGDTFQLTFKNNNAGAVTPKGILLGYAQQ